MEIDKRIKTHAKSIGETGIIREGGNRFVQGKSLDAIPC